jgi:hypothetical protein
MATSLPISSEFLRQHLWLDSWSYPALGIT